jgi:hypothetical protein
MPRPLTPFWLVTPSRCALLSPVRATWTAGIVPLVLLLVLALPAPAATSGTALPGEFTDLSLHESVVAGVRAGGNYYQLTADTLRSGGYPLRPFVSFRLPTHSIVQAALPPAMVIAALWLLAIGVAATWWARLAPALRRPPPRIAAAILLGGGMLVFVQPDLIVLHEIWAGLLVALSLGVRRPGRWVEAVAIALIAMLVRETATLYVLAMGALAWVEGARREAIGWAAALAVFAVVIGFHGHAVAQVTGPLDAQSAGWGAMLGPAFALRALATGTALSLLPTMLAVLLGGLALAGWAAWRDSTGLRVLATLSAYAVALGVFGRADTSYWMLMVAPLWLVGLVFVPDAVRDLAHATIDRRRVRVHRVSQ